MKKSNLRRWIIGALMGGIFLYYILPPEFCVALLAQRDLEARFKTIQTGMEIKDVTTLLKNYIQRRPENYVSAAPLTKSEKLPTNFSGGAMYYRKEIAGIFTIDYNHIYVAYRNGKVIEKSLITDYFDH